MKILFKNSIKELHISKTTPQIPSVCKIKKRNPRKVHSQSQSQKRKENIGIPTVFKNSQKFINVSNKGSYKQRKY